MKTLLWLRRDLRVHDHPALQAARAQAEHLLPVFCFDDRLLHGRHASGPRTQFLIDSLADLDQSLQARGSKLVVRRGAPETEVAELVREFEVQRVHFTADVSPFARRRDERVTNALRSAGADVQVHPGAFIADELDSIRTTEDRPFTVFTSFWDAWREQPRRPVTGAPHVLPPVPSNLRTGRLPALSALGLKDAVQEAASGGETVGRKQLNAFVSRFLDGYADNRNAVGEDATSRLSPYLHLGCISSRELEQRVLDVGDKQSDALRRQLCWRDFYAHVLLHHPANARSEHQVRYRGRLRYSHARRQFEAWCEGRTGFPMVDAAMRQLQEQGWMHNRARLVVASFLTKDLALDWRWGERWFMRWLLDGDEANNNGNWQWMASVGVDPQPLYKRILNPARQQARFDPDGRYVRRFVAELRDVPDQYLAEPWEMPDDVQRKAGCVIGHDYPNPIVDHGAARRETLERYAEAG